MKKKPWYVYPQEKERIENILVGGEGRIRNLFDS